MKTCKKLLAITIALVLLVSTLVSGLVVSAKEAGTLVLTSQPITESDADTKATVDLTFEYGEPGVVAPHKFITISTDPTFVLEDVVVASVNGKAASEYGTETDGDGENAIILNPCPVYIEKDGINTSKGLVLLESKLDENTLITDVVVTATYTIPANTVAGKYPVTATADYTDYYECDDTLGITNGEIVVEAAAVEVHEAVAEWSYNDEYHWHACVIADCSEHINDAAYDYAAHSFGDWIVDTEATDSVSGSKHRECTCGKTETAVIPRLLKMNTVSLTLANNIAVNFKANADHFTTIGYTEPYAIFIMNDKETIVTEYTIEESTGRYVFSYSITPQTINDTIEYYLCATYQGEEYRSVSKTYVIADYCYTQLGKSSTSAGFKTLYVNLLNYCAEAQTYKKHHTDNLANAKLTEEQLALGTTGARDYTDVQNTSYVVIENPTAAFKSVGLLLDSAVAIHFTATLPSDISNITLKATNGKTEWITTSDQFIYNSTSGRYEIDFVGLAAHQMDDNIEFTFYNGDTAISNTFLYSIETYAARQLSKLQSSDPGLAKVIVAMMNYGDSANACQ